MATLPPFANKPCPRALQYSVYCCSYLLHYKIEIIGSSDKGWEDAAQAAVDEASKTLHGIHGIEIMDMTAIVDESTGKISYYHASVKVAFAVEH
jgi:dodecin